MKGLLREFWPLLLLTAGTYAVLGFLFWRVS